MKFKSIALLTLSVLTLTSTFTGCGKASDTNTIKLGINGNEYRVWDYVKEELAKENINLEVVSFSDYIQPNIALSEGEIDINSFQTNIYFNQFKADHNLDLTSIGNTVFAPMGIYTEKLTDLNAIGAGGKVAIPNDVTNGGRALLLLEQAGLIEVKDEAGLTPNVKDITSNPKNLEITEMAAAQIPRSLADIDLGVINSGVAVDANLNPTSDALLIEDTTSDKAVNYYNIFAVKTKDQDRPELKRLVEIYQSEHVAELLQEIYKGAMLPIF